jgi:hypothetical protein
MGLTDDEIAKLDAEGVPSDQQVWTPAVIADEHGVRYDAWEVARNSTTGELRPVE